jgi:hypothetical protein
MICLGTLHSFLVGASTIGFFAVAVFFLRFWRETGERLFVLFAVAFAALAINRGLLGLTAFGQETRPYIYVVRLVAYVVIGWAVIDKNRRWRQGGAARGSRHPEHVLRGQQSGRGARDAVIAPSPHPSERNVTPGGISPAP